MRKAALLAPLGFVAALWTGGHADRTRTDIRPTAAIEIDRDAPRRQTNSVAISPGPSTVVGGAVTVTVTWCGYPVSPATYMDINSRIIKVNGVDVTGDFDLQFDQAACGFVGSVADEVLYTSTGEVTVDPTTGPVTVFADVSNALNYHWQATEMYHPPGPRAGVSVVSELPFVSPLTGTRHTRFTITNHSNAPDTFAISASECSGSGVTSCALSRASSVIVASGASTNATINYTATGSTGARGLIRLRAVNNAGTERDSAWTDVTVAAAPSVGVTIVGTAPGLNDNAMRDACLTVALTDGAASECGDLRLVHALPAVRSMGAARAPTLLYNSQHARPRPLVLADVRLSSSVALPPNVTACIKVASVNRGCTTYDGANWDSAGFTRRIAVLGDTGTWNSGAVDYTLEITASNANPDSWYEAAAWPPR